MKPERWVDIAGFEGRYQISDQGRVKSVERYVLAKNRYGGVDRRHVPQRILALHTWGAPYPGVVLKTRDGVSVRWMVHQLVAEAFIHNPQGHKQINHLDCNTFNAAYTNLEWCDQSHNMKYAHEVGRRRVGSDHHFASLPRDRNGWCMPAPADEIDMSNAA